MAGQLGKCEESEGQPAETQPHQEQGNLPEGLAKLLMDLRTQAVAAITVQAGSEQGVPSMDELIASLTSGDLRLSYAVVKRNRPEQARCFIDRILENLALQDAGGRTAGSDQLMNVRAALVYKDGDRDFLRDLFGRGSSSDWIAANPPHERFGRFCELREGELMRRGAGDDDRDTLNEARALLRRNERYWKQTGDTVREGSALYELSQIAGRLGDFAMEKKLCLRSADLCDRTHNELGACAARQNALLAELKGGLRDPAALIEPAEGNLMEFERMSRTGQPEHKDALRWVANALDHLIRFALAAQNRQEAAGYFKRLKELNDKNPAVKGEWVSDFEKFAQELSS